MKYACFPPLYSPWPEGERGQVLFFSVIKWYYSKKAPAWQVPLSSRAVLALPMPPPLGRREILAQKYPDGIDTKTVSMVYYVNNQ